MKREKRDRYNTMSDRYCLSRAGSTNTPYCFTVTEIRNSCVAYLKPRQRRHRLGLPLDRRPP
ncbi:hypothetical protein BN903_15 [Halorubrum sp. AJ67]|nr:hypothetical protein BN903_15 [Halorubrum sp. AJ67]